MTTTNSLYLHEEIALLALKDREGTYPFDGYFTYAIGGAILAELAHHERIGLEDYKKKKRVQPLSSQPLGEPLMDEAIALINSKKKPATLETWVNRLSSLKRLKHRIALQLCQRGILRADEQQILIFFKRKVYPEINHEAERAVIKRLRQMVLSDSPAADVRTVQLLALAFHGSLLKPVFDKATLKAQRTRIQKIIEDEVFGKAVKAVVEETQTAAVAICCAGAAPGAA
jgi:hypothetical protein